MTSRSLLIASAIVLGFAVPVMAQQQSGSHRYVIFFKYSDQAIKALIDNPQQDRVGQATKLTEAFGGKLETTFGFPMGGEWDGMVIQQFPDDVTLNAVNLVLRSTGNFVRTQAVPLLTIQEVQQSLAKAKNTPNTYTAPTATR
jgi:uncharacterized protein with GYD domain